MATVLHLSFEDNKHKVARLTRIQDPITLLQLVCPKAYAQTEAGQHFYKTVLPYYRQLSKDSKGTWRNLEIQDRSQKHIIIGYSEVDEYSVECNDAEIPF